MVTEVVGPGTNPVADGELSHTHRQDIPDDLWVVNHGMGYRPGGIHIVDSAGTSVMGEIQHIDENTLTVGFGAAMSGVVYIS